MKRIFVPLVICMLVLTGCSSATKGPFKLPLSPVPLVMNVDPALVTHLIVSSATGEWAKQAIKDGAKSQAVIYYIPAKGSRAIFMSVYEFPASKFDRLKNPNQPPLYGQEVIRKNGEVFSVAGPQDSIFDPKTQDGKNITALYLTIYKASTYTAP